MTTTDVDPDLLSINTIRGLCMDAIQKANSGHPGTPLDIAPVAYTLWQRFLLFDPSDPIWPNRDRFVLSEGHASALLWSLLHLANVRAVDPAYEVLGTPAVTLGDLETFRQLGSKCPGHPEYRWTSGVETTTGPLGQGVATSVGMAIGGKWLAARYNRSDFTLFDFDVYALAGDGCMMEGISSEAASLAAHLGLSNLCWIYDSNRVTIEGHTDIAFTEDVAARFVAYGWNLTTVADANDTEAVARAFHVFQAERERPTLILVHSHIGYGSPVEDSPKAHGEPLGPAGVKATKTFLGMPPDAEFFVPDGVYEHFEQGIGARGLQARCAWESKFAKYRGSHPGLADEIERMQRRDLPDTWEEALPFFAPDPAGLATRDSSGQVLNDLAQRDPMAPRRLGRPVAVDEDQPRLRRCRRFPGRQHRRAQPALRNPRACVGRHLQRARSYEAATLLVGLSDLLRLREGSHQAVGSDGDPRRSYLHSRFDWRRGGRSDPPACRAAGVTACGSRAARLPSR